MSTDNKALMFENTEVDVPTVFILLLEELTMLLNAHITEQVKKMEDVNGKIKVIGGIIKKVTDLSAGLKDGNDKVKIGDDLREELKSYGIDDVPEGEVIKSQLDSYSETLKIKQDALSKDSQVYQTRLQGVIDMQQRGYKMMTDNSMPEAYDKALSIYKKAS